MAPLPQLNPATAPNAWRLPLLRCLLIDDQEDLFLKKLARELADGLLPHDLDQACAAKDDFRAREETLATLAARLGRHDALDALLRAGADPNSLIDGETPLEGAVANGHLACVKLLLSRGASPEALGRGPAPLAIAARFGRLDCALALLDAGADLDKPDARGRSPSQAARALPGSAFASHAVADALDALSEAKALHLSVETAPNARRAAAL
jgi:hypothetical protein